ncbi:hypothetical protein [Vogesella indigofera]|uniref:Lipocalin-like protein n=1 Tax=Vogesella indigofera TaxID=45465 RepID=A0ABT5HZF1_VOGIN|nr:hypothetical protein [Vogesella indigofera]MDC7689299.1 hypothetical protein [Vogesella indigofera]
MNKHLITSSMLLIFCLALPGCSTPAVQTQLTSQLDQDRSARLIGTWRFSKSDDELSLQGTTTFRQDGTFTGSGIAQMRQQQIPISGAGTWLVRDGYLVERITAMSPPILRPGHTTRDLILDITPETFSYQTEKGEIIVEHRQE